MQNFSLPLRRFAALSALLAASAAQAGPPQGAFLYCLRNGRDDPTQNRLDTVNPETAEVLTSLQVTLPGFSIRSANALARRKSDGALFAILRTGFPGFGTANRLVTIDPSTGAATEVGELLDSFSGLTFGADGALYGVTGRLSVDDRVLFRLDTTTAEPTAVFPVRHGLQGQAIATMSDGRLLHASGAPTSGGSDPRRVVEFVNLASTGGMTDINTSHQNPFNAEVFALAWSGVHAGMYLTDVGGDIYSISRTTGASTFVCSTGLTLLKGLAFDGATLYGADDPFGPPSVHTLDLATGAALHSAPISATGFSFLGATGLAVQPGTHALFAVLRVDGEEHRVLAVINPATGAADVRGALPDQFEGLAFRANGTLIGVTGEHAEDDSALYAIDPLTGDTSFVRHLGNGAHGEAIAIADDGFLYHASGRYAGAQYFERVDLSAVVAPRFTRVVLPDSHTFSFHDETLALGWSDALGRMFMTERNGALHTISLGAPAAILPPAPAAHDIKGLAFAGAVMYALTNSVPSRLLTLHPLAGATLASVDVTLPGFTIEHANGLARSPINGKLYAILTDSTSARRLVTIDPSTGVATNIGLLSDKFAGLAFRANGTLIGVTGDGANTPSSLHTINASNASSTLLLSLGNGDDGEAIAIAGDGFLYHASGLSTHNQYWERVNLDTHAVTNIPVPGCEFPFDEALALATRPNSPIALVSDIDGDLWSLDTTTGVATFVAEFREEGGPDVLFMKGMAYVPPSCPGDTNGDGAVDFFDLNNILTAFASHTGDPNFIPGADLNGDGAVNFFDLNTLLTYFGTAC